jgi:hypothetical protein
MAMNLQDFQDSIDAAQPPKGLDAALRALWFEAKGDWDEAHREAQSKDDETGAWVHAYLHRVEGDEGNAGYWYRRANRPHSASSLSDEWREIAAALL